MLEVLKQVMRCGHHRPHLINQQEVLSMRHPMLESMTLLRAESLKTMLLKVFSMFQGIMIEILLTLKQSLRARTAPEAL